MDKHYFVEVLIVIQIAAFVLGQDKYYSEFFGFVNCPCFTLPIIFNADYAPYLRSFSLMVVANPKLVGTTLIHV